MNIFERLLFKAKTGASIVDIGEADEVVIRYKDKLISILESPDGDIKSLGWMGSSALHTDVPVRDFWIAKAPNKRSKS